MASVHGPNERLHLEAVGCPLGAAKFDRIELERIAQQLPEMAKLVAFSGIVALRKGNGEIVSHCHCPEQVAFTADQPFNVRPPTG